MRPVLRNAVRKAVPQERSRAVAPAAEAKRRRRVMAPGAAAAAELAHLARGADGEFA